MGSIPGLGKSPGVENGNPLWYSYLENSIDRGAWRALVHRIAKRRIWLSMHTHTHTHTYPYLCVCVSYSVMTICDLMDCSPPSSSVHRIFHARILEWVAIPFSRGSSPPRDRTWVSCIAGRFLTDWDTREAPNLTHHGAWTHNPAIKSLMLYQLSEPGGYLYLWSPLLNTLTEAN